MTSSNTKLTIDEVKHVAKLANLSLSEKALLDFKNKLSETLDYINQLNKINTAQIVPTYQVTGKINELREDVVIPSLPQAKALHNAKKIYNGYFVSKIVWN